MKINVIITCYNKETYLPGLLSVLKEYTLIEPIIIVGYSGKNELQCDFRIENPGIH